MPKSPWLSDKLIKKKWPDAEVVWTSVTMDIRVVKTGEQWGYGDVFRVVTGDRYNTSLYTYDEAYLEAVRRELSEEALLRNEICRLTPSRYTEKVK